MGAPSESPDKQMKLRYAGVCRICGAHLEARSEAIYERGTKTIRCIEHEAVRQPLDDAVTEIVEGEPPAEELAFSDGDPGGSARREYERRHDKRDKRVRDAHPKLGGLLLALSDDPQSTQAWDVGALGEERLGSRLSEFASPSLRVLHDRRIPGTRANIDHLAVTPTGVWVIDAKKYKGRPRPVIEGGMIKPRSERLFVGTRDCSKLVDGMRHQLEVVRRMVEPDVPLHGVLCFIEADWPLIGGPFKVRDVLVAAPKRLYPKLKEEGPLSVHSIAELHRALATGLLPA